MSMLGGGASGEEARSVRGGLGRSWPGDLGSAERRSWRGDAGRLGDVDSLREEEASPPFASATRKTFRWSLPSDGAGAPPGVACHSASGLDS